MAVSERRRHLSGHLWPPLSPKDITTVEQAILLTLRAYRKFIA